MRFNGSVRSRLMPRRHTVTASLEQQQLSVVFAIDPVLYDCSISLDVLPYGTSKVRCAL